MTPLPLSRWRLSTSSATEPRPGLDAPLCVERLPLELEPQVQPTLELLASLPAPFQRLLEVRRTREAVEVVHARFCGIDGQRLVEALSAVQRLLPLDVWLAGACAWLQALQHLAAQPSGEAVPQVHQLGVAIDCAQVVAVHRHNHAMAVQPPHVIGEETIPRSISSEALRGRPLTPRSLVFSAAASLVELLTLEQPFKRKTQLATAQAILAGEAHWTAARHPQCPPMLAAVLARAMDVDPAQRPRDPSALRAALLEWAGVAPAAPGRVAGAWFGVQPALIESLVTELTADPASLPAHWRSGGLAVLEDRLLQEALPVESFPTPRA